MSDKFDKLLSRYKGAKAKTKPAKFSFGDYWREVCEPHLDDLTPDTDLGSWLLQEEGNSSTDPPHEWTRHRPAALKMLKKHVASNWGLR